MAVALELASCSEGGGGAGASSFGAIPNRRRILRSVSISAPDLLLRVSEGMERVDSCDSASSSAQNVGLGSYAAEEAAECPVRTCCRPFLEHNKR